jgi:hypothetical protein
MPNSAGGLILDFAVQTIRGVAVFQPVMNGKHLELFLIKINCYFRCGW